MWDIRLEKGKQTPGTIGSSNSGNRRDEHYIGRRESNAKGVAISGHDDFSVEVDKRSAKAMPTMSKRSVVAGVK